VPLFEVRPPTFAGTDFAIKRAFDLAVSALVVVVGLPLWALIAAAIKLTSRGRCSTATGESGSASASSGC
jgi:lipopolysaccharide/colanic/teichoic acid biosynthesis glycosyltransferase